MPIEERCPTKLLDDTPADTDDFGGHESVARSIAEIVQTEAGGKAIGLEGGWGAGKSTIVNLASTILNETKNGQYRTVVFDTWAHQGDPLRRTVLENLITRIRAFNWVNRKKWHSRLAALTKRRSEETTRVIPRLTRTGIGFALTLLLIPVGSALISAGATLPASQHASGELAAWLLRFGIAGASAAVIYYGVVAIIRCLRTRFGSAGGDQAHGLEECLPLVTGQGSTESRTIVTRTPDPTSVEFESEFRDLLKEALKPDGRRLLLVIDNLDRVDPSDALSIWSTLQTFLGHSDRKMDDWIDRLWVLIPYDGNSILRLWDKSVRNRTSKTGSALATSFLDKTFQLRFKAPPLLLLDWREFLQKTLQKALPRHDEADFRDVYRAYAAKGGFEATAPTPRDLKIFVNQIGSLHRVRQDEFPLSYLACYVLLQREGQDVLDELLSEAESELPSRIIGSHWKDVIAALHFGVDTQEARQLLLRRPIEAALANGDGTRLSELAVAHPAGFWSVLEDCVPAGTKDWNTLSPSELGTAVSALAESKVLDQQDDRPEAEIVRSGIGTAAAAMQAWAPFNAAMSQGMVATVSLVPNPEEIIPQLIEAAANAPVESRARTSDEETQRVSPRVWMSSAIYLIKGLVDLGFSEQIGEGIRVPLDAQQWLDAANDVADKDPRGQFLKYFDLQAISDIEQLLAQRVSQGQIDEPTFLAVRSAMATRSSNALKNVADAAVSRLRSGQRIDFDHLARLLQISRSSWSAGIIGPDEYKAFAKSGNCLAYLAQTGSTTNPEAIAECIFAYLVAVPDASQINRGSYSVAGHRILTRFLQNPDNVGVAEEHFTTIAKETEGLPLVFEMATANRPVPPLLAWVLRALLSSKDVSKPPELVRANWSVIREVLASGEGDSSTLGTFLGALPGLADIVGGVVKSTFDVSDSGLYVALLGSGTDENFVKWCENGFSSVSREMWSEELNSQGDLLKLVIELQARGATVAPTVAFFDGLNDYAEAVANRDGTALDDKTWRRLFALLDGGQQELFLRRAYEILEVSRGEASAEFFNLFGDMLSNRELLANQRRFIDEVCRPILENRNARGITWVADIADSDPALLNEHRDDAAINHLKERIRQRLKDTSDRDPIFHDLERIGAALGIRRPKRESS